MTVIDQNSKLASLRVDASGRLLVDVAAGGGLPSQTGNSGKVLTTNGTVASWALANTFAHVGTWASRPSAATAGAGAVMVTTDTFRRTQWYSDGADWFPVGGETLLYALQAPIVGASSTNATVNLPTPTILAGIMGTYGELVFDIGVRYSSNTPSAVAENMTFGGQTIMNVVGSPTSRNRWHIRYVKNTAVATQQGYTTSLAGGYGTSGATDFAGTVNTAADVAIGGSFSATDATIGTISIWKFTISLRK